jgi:uncharacterized protein YjbJ (UPF0337 family)
MECGMCVTELGTEWGKRVPTDGTTDWKEQIVNSASKMKWEGRWDQLKGKAKQQWGNLTDDDLDVAEGHYDEMIGRIKERTGETREEIESRLDA